MKKEKQYVTVLEIMNDDNVWVWVGLYGELTPKQAIQAYCEDEDNGTGECGKITKEAGRYGIWYSELADVRALRAPII